MKIYTRQGDRGQTRIYADKPLKRSKDADELQCYGTLDELNSHLGLLIAQLQDNAPALLTNIQRKLFQIGFAISATSDVVQDDIDQLEQAIDAMTAELAPQTSFILPGGCIAAAQAHVCRTVVRRAERHLVTLLQSYEVNQCVIAYINRLSDYFFVLARHINAAAGIDDQKL